MRTDAWVHVAVGASAAESHLLEQIEPNGLVCVLDGTQIGDLDAFYIAIEWAVPLIRGFGRNLDALVDLVRSFGWGDHAGRSHCLIWRRPERMLETSPESFWEVVDILLGVSKELLVGEELDPTFDPNDQSDWIPTRLDLVFLVTSEAQAVALKARVERLSDDWKDEFESLDIAVDLRL